MPEAIIRTRMPCAICAELAPVRLVRQGGNRPAVGTMTWEGECPRCRSSVDVLVTSIRPGTAVASVLSDAMETLARVAHGDRLDAAPPPGRLVALADGAEVLDLSTWAEERREGPLSEAQLRELEKLGPLPPHLVRGKGGA